MPITCYICDLLHFYPENMLCLAKRTRSFELELLLKKPNLSKTAQTALGHAIALEV